MNKRARGSNIVEILNKNSSITEGARETTLSFSEVWQVVLGKDYSNIKKMDKIMNSSSNNKKIK